MRQEVRFDRILKYQVTAELTQPLHVGSAGGDNEEVLIHPATGLPFLQASGIAGVLRGYMDKSMGRAEDLFGSSGDDAKECRITVTDGIFTKPDAIRMEKRPHVKINRETGSVSSVKIKGTANSAGQKFDMDYVGAGAAFRFELYIKTDLERMEPDQTTVLGMLSALNNYEIQFGGKRSEGCGQVRISRILYRVFVMTDSADRAKWAREESLPEAEYKNITASLSSVGSRDYVITLSGKTENDILIRTIAVNKSGKDAPDAANIQNSRQEYIIPGSSIKGAIRDRAEKICQYLQNHGTYCTDLIARTFGEAAEGTGEGIAGNASFADIVIGDRESNDNMPLQHRIHIDKFTGGVMNGALINEKNAAGSIRLEIRVHHGDYQKKSTAILLMALRDLANGLYNLGSGYSIGKGFLKPEKLELKTPEGRAVYYYSKKGSGSETGLFTECIQSLR